MWGFIASKAVGGLFLKGLLVVYLPSRIMMLHWGCISLQKGGNSTIVIASGSLIDTPILPTRTNVAMVKFRIPPLTFVTSRALRRPISGRDSVACHICFLTGSPVGVIHI